MRGVGARISFGGSGSEARASRCSGREVSEGRAARVRLCAGDRAHLYTRAEYLHACTVGRKNTLGRDREAQVELHVDHVRGNVEGLLEPGAPALGHLRPKTAPGAHGLQRHRPERTSLELEAGFEHGDRKYSFSARENKVCRDLQAGSPRRNFKHAGAPHHAGQPDKPPHGLLPWTQANNLFVQLMIHPARALQSNTH
jgi:hypothetical protein